MTKVAAGRLRIGCSGWEYMHWRGTFYPEEVPQARWLEYYAASFDTVEVNNSFYRLPEASTFEAWRNRVPRRFLFAVKASRFLTHMKKLKEPAEPLARLIERTAALGTRLGPILYQLPPRWAINLERLDTFLAALPGRLRHVVEFRDPSWYDERVYHALAARRVALCLHDMAGSASPRLAVGPFLYLRFHGTGPRYGGGYPDWMLREWAGWLAPHIARGARVYAYFNNDVGGHAPRDAARLRAFMGGARL